MKYGIIGCGVSGILVCLELLYNGIKPSEINVIDPYFDGGSLGRKWGPINSNTTWSQIQKALEKYPTANIHLRRYSMKYTSDQIIPLYELSQILRDSIQPFFGSLNIYQSKCKKILETSDSQWKLQLLSDVEIVVDTVFLCQGGKPKKEDLGKPLISLDIAFDVARLKRYCNPNECIGIFGASHSGTLVARNCVDAGCRVILFHKSNPPFVFARDGHYDGIKQESAEVADLILTKKGIGEHIQLIHLEKPLEAIKMIAKCHHLIQCIGFESRVIEIKLEDGTILNSRTYDDQSGQLIPNKSLYGFGLAYPGKTRIDERTYVDVSIPSFQEQIEKCLPAVFTKKQ